MLLKDWERKYISSRGQEVKLCVSKPPYDYVVSPAMYVYNYRHLQDCLIEPEIPGREQQGKRYWKVK